MHTPIITPGDFITTLQDLFQILEKYFIIIIIYHQVTHENIVTWYMLYVNSTQFFEEILSLNDNFGMDKLLLNNSSIFGSTSSNI